MVRHVTSLLLFVCAASIGDVGFAQEGQTRVWATLDSEIRGRIELRGCAPDPSELQLAAAAVDAGPIDRDSATLVMRAESIPARIEPTADRHAFDFVIRGLDAASLYRLSFSAPLDPICGTVFWRNATEGLVVSGGDPVLIEGVAVRTELEVQDPSTDEWVGMEPLDFTDPAAAIRRLRWKSNVADVVGGELQISTAVFPRRGNFGACDEPEGGILYRQAVSADSSGEWLEIDPIDFNSIIQRRLFAADAASATAEPPDVTLRMLLVGRPIYARVVPITARGHACDTTEQGIPGWIVFAKVPTNISDEPEPLSSDPVLEPGAGHIYRSPYFHRPSQYQPTVIHPTYTEYGYRVVAPHLLPTTEGCAPNTTTALKKAGAPYVPAYDDPMGCQLVNAAPWDSGKYLKEGFRFQVQKYYGYSGGGFAENFVNFVTAGFNTIGVAVDFFAMVYNGAVDGAKDIAYDGAVAILGPICSNNAEKCQQVIELGMTYGMLSMGLPPSVPNWDGLKEEGLQYLTAELAEEFEAETGIPAEATNPILEVIVQQAINDMTTHRGGDDPRTSWYVRDLGVAPASMTVTIVKNGLSTLSIDVALFGYKSPVSSGTQVPLPHKFPPPFFSLEHQLLQVPMVLPPNFDGIPAPICRSSFYTVPAQTCFANPFATATTQPICQVQVNTGPNTPWTNYPCKSYEDIVAIYYRNAWAEKVAATKCALISAVTLAKAKNLSTPYIAWPKHTFTVGAVAPPTLSGTWSGAFINACP